jgi:hypothetical protein
LCKWCGYETSITTARERALHSTQPLSTAFRKPFVETVGNPARNSAQFITLPAFHFYGAGFSKTG